MYKKYFFKIWFLMLCLVGVFVSASCTDLNEADVEIKNVIQGYSNFGTPEVSFTVKNTGSQHAYGVGVSLMFYKGSKRVDSSYDSIGFLGKNESAFGEAATFDIDEHDEYDTIKIVVSWTESETSTEEGSASFTNEYEFNF